MVIKKIDQGNAFDWGRVSKEYARFRDIYPEEFYRGIVDLGLCVKGQNVLDLGTGTGVLPRNMHRFGATFTGADISENQIAEARRLSRADGLDIEYVVSPAEEVSFPDCSFDVITACQCFIYFDKSVVLPNVHRMLKPGGHFCVLWMGWLPFEDEIAAASEQLVLQFNPTWTGAGFKRFKQGVPEWSKPLFKVANSIEYDIKIPFTRESWNGRIKACRGIGASSLSEKEIAEFERRHTALTDKLPERFEILHYVMILDLQKD